MTLNSCHLFLYFHDSTSIYFLYFHDLTCIHAIWMIVFHHFYTWHDYVFAKSFCNMWHKNKYHFIENDQVKDIVSPKNQCHIFTNVELYNYNSRNATTPSLYSMHTPRSLLSSSINSYNYHCKNQTFYNIKILQVHS